MLFVQNKLGNRSLIKALLKAHMLLLARPPRTLYHKFIKLQQAIWRHINIGHNQAITEKAHSTFKHMIQKQKGGDIGPIAQLQKTLLTLNLFNLNFDFVTPAKEKYLKHIPHQKH